MLFRKKREPKHENLECEKEKRKFPRYYCDNCLIDGMGRDTALLNAIEKRVARNK